MKIRRDIIFSDMDGRFRIGHNVRMSGNFAFSDSAIMSEERIIPKVDRADRPVFDLPDSGGKKKKKEYVWLGTNDGYLLRVDRESGVVKKVSIGGNLQRVAVDGKFVYVLNFDAGVLSRVNKDTFAIVNQTVPSSGKNYGLGVDSSDVWYSTADPNDSSLTANFPIRRIPKATWNGGNVTTGEVNYGFPTALFVDKDYVWVTNTIYLKPLEGVQGQAGASSTTSAVVFNHPNASTVDDFYNKQDLWVYYGGWGGSSEVRTIVDYDGATKTAYVSPPYNDPGGFFNNPSFWVWYRVRKYDVGRINKSSLNVTPVLVMQFLTDVAADVNYVWACASTGRKVLRISKADFSITAIDMGSPNLFVPFTVALDSNFVWVADNKFGSPGVIRIKKSDLSFQKINITETNFRAYGISIDNKYVWVTGEDDNRLVRIAKDSFEEKSFTLPSVAKCRGNMTEYAYKALLVNS